jgi:hypothetical protein
MRRRYQTPREEELSLKAAAGDRVIESVRRDANGIQVIRFGPRKRISAEEAVVDPYADMQKTG